MATVAAAKPPFRADHVGSFLRPDYLLDARRRFRAGEIDRAALREVEDEAIRGVVAFQEGLGLKSVTDGEFRRTHFHSDFLLQLDGIETKGGSEVKFHQHGGKELDFAPPVMAVTGKISHGHDIEVDNFKYLAAQVSQTP